MIASLRGRMLEKGAGTLVVDVGGVGYRVLMPSSVLYRLPEPEADIMLHIRTVVREDAITLYGFDEARERELFDLLVTVSGVGPKTALAALSGLPFNHMVRAICDQDTRALTKIPGLGKKTSERVILELKDKVTDLAAAAAIEMRSEAPPPAAQDALSALQNLGYRPVEAERSIDRVLRELGSEASLEDILSAALKLLGRV